MIAEAAELGGLLKEKRSYFRIRARAKQAKQWSREPTILIVDIPTPLGFSLASP